MESLQRMRNKKDLNLTCGFRDASKFKNRLAYVLINNSNIRVN